MQSYIFLNSKESIYKPNIKKKKKVSTNNSKQYINLKKTSSHYKNNHLKIFLLVCFLILASTYYLNYYSFYFFLKGINYIVKKISHNSQVVRKVMIYLTILLIIEIIVINLFLILFNLIN